MRTTISKTLLAFSILATSFKAASQAPANDNCSNATLLTPGTSCSTVSATLLSATNSSVSGSTCGTADDDVWFRFVAQQTNATITISGMSTANPSIGRNNPTIDLFNASASNGCLGSFLVCNTAGSNVNTLSLSATSLTIGNTYYIRVYTTASGAPSNNAGFNICVTHTLPPTVVSGRGNEVFQQTTLSAANVLADPWEITYGPDGFLWVTEAKGYKVYRIDPTTGARNTVLDVSQGATFLPSADQTFNVQFASTFSPWPQGGFAGLAIHPEFTHATTPKRFVYVSYVHRHDSTAANNRGVFFTNRVVRFTYNTGTNRLESPVSLCDTLPGSNDHNSQRMIIAPVDGVQYLFYASGDMGSGQFSNANRPIKSLINASYEGKILRFNLEADNDAGTLDRWIPNDNPFNGATQSAVWATGMRNNQGFALANINGTDILYGSSHGPYSDDEINIIQRARNYGHPLVIGYAADGNYNNSKAGTSTGTMPLITSEAANAAAIGSSYMDPLFSAYAASQATVNNIYLTNPSNGGWPSEGWSGMDYYGHTAIPGWKNSLIMCSLKWGRILRLKLGVNGTTILPTGGQDTISYFGSQNRFRDVAFSPDGKDIFVIMDRSTTTSGPSSANPVVPACQGCLQKYTFIGYEHNSGTNRSNIPNTIAVETSGTVNSCNTGTAVNITAANGNNGTNVWVPITGPNGNIIAEIKANGNNLGNVETSYYLKSGSLLEDGARRTFMNRYVSITPQFQPSTPVSVRFYVTRDEFNKLDTGRNSTGHLSTVSSISDIRVLKNDDLCGVPFTTTSNWITPSVAETFGADGYVLQFDITSFSTFYFGSASMIVLDQDLLTLKAELQGRTAALQWKVDQNNDVRGFEVERSSNGSEFQKIGTVMARTGAGAQVYHFNDQDVLALMTDHAYYRIRLLSANGSGRYSKTISLKLPQQYFTFNVLPNPVKDVLNLQVTAKKTGELHIHIYDANGRLVQRDRQFAGVGTNTFRFNTSKWGSQQYTITVHGSDQNLLLKKTVVKL